MSETVDDVRVLPNGARVRILRRPNRLGFVAVRDDGLPVYGAKLQADVDDYLRRYGDVIQPAPAHRPRFF